MESKPHWTFEGSHAKLDQLDPRTRSKAVEIAHGLMENGKLSEEEAIEEAIIRAEEWFYGTEG